MHHSQRQPHHQATRYKQDHQAHPQHQTPAPPAMQLAHGAGAGASPAAAAVAAMAAAGAVGRAEQRLCSRLGSMLDAAIEGFQRNMGEVHKIYERTCEQKAAELHEARATHRQLQQEVQIVVKDTASLVSCITSTLDLTPGAFATLLNMDRDEDRRPRHPRHPQHEESEEDDDAVSGVPNHLMTPIEDTPYPRGPPPLPPLHYGRREQQEEEQEKQEEEHPRRQKGRKGRPAPSSSSGPLEPTSAKRPKHEHRHERPHRYQFQQQQQHHHHHHHHHGEESNKDDDGGGEYVESSSQDADVEENSAAPSVTRDMVLENTSDDESEGGALGHEER